MGPSRPPQIPGVARGPGSSPARPCPRPPPGSPPGRPALLQEAWASCFPRLCPSRLPKPPARGGLGFAAAGVGGGRGASPARARASGRRRADPASGTGKLRLGRPQTPSRSRRWWGLAPPPACPVPFVSALGTAPAGGRRAGGCGPRARLRGAFRGVRAHGPVASRGRVGLRLHPAVAPCPQWIRRALGSRRTFNLPAERPARRLRAAEAGPARFRGEAGCRARSAFRRQLRALALSVRAAGGCFAGDEQKCARSRGQEKNGRRRLWMVLEVAAQG